MHPPPKQSTMYAVLTVEGYSFGTTALILQLIPLLSMFFLLTTAAGSALWVVELERKRKLVEERFDRPEDEYRDQVV